MLSVTAKEIPREQAIFNTGWAMLKKYYNISPDNEKDEIWEAIIAEANTLYSMGKGTAAEPISKGLALSIVETIEKLYNERKATAATK